MTGAAGVENEFLLWCVRTSHQWDPLGLAVAGAMATIFGVALWRGRGAKRVARATSFGAGLGVLVLALWSPLHDHGHWSFAAHMAQHVILIAIVPPLILLARPGLAVREALPRSWVRGVAPVFAAGASARRRALSGPGRVCIALAHVAVLWIVHAPVVYEAALFDPTLHFIEHLALIGSAYAVWWAAMTAPAVRAGGSVLGLALSGAAGAVLATLIIVSPTEWAAAHNPAAVGLPLTPAEDQQLGGGIMVLVGSVVWTLAAATCFVRWLRAVEQRQAVREQRVRAGTGAGASADPAVGLAHRDVT
ncbi:cytochrome c oxidase assembly protein [Egibacter rhizosphaerae]|uniref:Cytochrome c oxidase assembly protein n=1 Tax=Egibacter rhizosphaerae TaxID=1670831 RepID=A0A411YFB9_9ACTN|nr:cytochrome c oxidase assembly protein [Egibacter rhizosphaerae]QBI19943.1 cytochrome c oxidase assembly protein [Egibacter rhizosphaerae]